MTGRLRGSMDNRRVALAGILVFCLFSASIASILLSDEKSRSIEDSISILDPLLQDEGHDHRNATQHVMYTENIQPVSFNELTAPGNAEIQVAESPDGRTYAYIAGWSELHIVDVTNPENTTVTGVYVDPNTQVLDVKYLQYNGDEYVVVQNQLVDPGNADPNVGEWGDPVQVTVTLIDVSDKSNPTYVDAWYDADHPSGPHNLYTHLIDNEWYIFVANPDYEQCDVGQGDACGGITIAHLNFDGPGDSPRILKVGEAEVNWQNTLGGWIYIHDMTVQTWPGEDQQDPRYGRTYIYGAYWEAGLRIFDVSDVPHPQNSPIEYAFIAGGCAATLGTQLTCNWRAPEVGQWMEFADLDDDGQIDCGCTGNENGGRASYIHYAEPIDDMVDASHLGYPEGKMHLTFLATEVLETSVGTGLGYLLDTTDYEMLNGQITFRPKIIHSWEIPFAEDHHIPGGDEWLLFSPHNSDAQIFPTDSSAGLPDQSLGGNWDGRIYLSSYHAGLWIIDIETLMLEGKNPDKNRTEVHSVSTIGYHIPHGQDGTPLDSSYYDFGWTPFIWAAEYHNGYTYLSCITTGLYIVQLDIDKPYHVS
jgi:hypothetical protein|tara:strand:+ start:340 stop:2106 length:1767 start_codon:yes stop_codon:yes gene_type:complete